MADWLQYDPNTLPWMRRSGEAAREATAHFQFGAQLAQRREEQQTEDAYRERVLKLQKDTLDLKKASELQMGEGMVEVGKVLSEIAANGDWTNPQARAKFFGVISRYPSITKSPIYDNLLQNFQAADTAAARATLETERQAAITDRTQSAIDARFQALDLKFENMIKMEGVKAENRTQLEEFRNELNMLRDQFKPQSGSHYDLPYSQQILMKSELDEVNRLLRDYEITPEEATKRRGEISSKFTKQPTDTRIRVKSPDGKVGTISSDKLDAALKEGYQRVD